jgi:D-3-phosphoglycerate dehydrogenase
VIGKVGTILGSRGINIASMQVGRSEKAGNQMMVMAVESIIPQDVLEQLKAVDGILGATMVTFESLNI